MQFQGAEGRSGTLRYTVEAVKAVLVTHEHIDHTKALGQITKRTSVPVYASDGTARRLFSDKLVEQTAVIHPLSEIKSVPVDMDIDFFIHRMMLRKA